ncbi:calmodulin-like 3 [Linderina pennispora]|nr:calmodulin-like 3 [Linderina pennispora]
MSSSFTQGQIDELREAFGRFDAAKGGSVAVEELDAVYEALGCQFTKAEIQEHMGMVGQDDNGTFTFEQFVQFMAHKYAGDKDDDTKLREAFNRYDKNGDGAISPEELRSAMLSLGEDVTEEEVNKMVEEADIDGDGHVSFEEFATIMKSS